jgi:hypothetical protein
METSLHRQLKERYGATASQREVRVGEFRIDAIVNGEFIEVQQASLAALKPKLRALLTNHCVTVVKPLAARKQIIRAGFKRGQAPQVRQSPRHESVFDLFAELVHLVGLFPHPRLTIEVLLTDQQELRVPRKKLRRWGRDFAVADRRLLAVRTTHTLRTADDLAALLPERLDPQFTTRELAALAAIPRWLAQKLAYCLRYAGAVKIVGKRRGAWLYERCQSGQSRAA